MPSLNYGNVDAARNRAETTRNEVFVANKRNTANITYIFVDDGGVLGDNLVYESFPALLLPAVPATNDAVYFGIDSALADGGPFCSLVFNLIKPAIYNGSATIVWEYWDGAAPWGVLATTDHDMTDAGTGPFSKPGINTVNWPPQTNWVATSVGGVTAYWVRARVILTGGTVTPPTQDGHIYTPVWPYIEIGEDAISGDLPAYAKFNIYNESDDNGVSGTWQAYFDRVILGGRAVDRGEDFTACINLADKQNPTGITIYPFSPAAFATDVNIYPSSRGISATFGGSSAYAEKVRASISAPLSRQYNGRFRVFLRYCTSGTTPIRNIELGIKTQIGGYGLAYPKEIGKASIVNTAAQDDFRIVELGVAEFNVTNYTPVSIDMSIWIGTDGAFTLELIDLWLIPADEVIIEAYDPTNLDEAVTYYPFYLSADHVTDHHEPFFVVKNGSNLVRVRYLGLASPHLVVPPRERTRFHFLTTYTVVDREYSSFRSLSRVQLTVNQRYLSGRGDS